MSSSCSPVNTPLRWTPASRPLLWLGCGLGSIGGKGRGYKLAVDRRLIVSGCIVLEDRTKSLGSGLRTCDVLSRPSLQKDIWYRAKSSQDQPTAPNMHSNRSSTRFELYCSLCVNSFCSFESYTLIRTLCRMCISSYLEFSTLFHSCYLNRTNRFCMKG